jgi:Skp family chaperone for outer membrane proteins
MKARRLRRSLAVAILLLAAAATSLPAPARAQESNLKVGLVITQKLLASTKIGKNAAEQLKGKKESAQEDLDRKAAEINDLKKDLEKRLMVLNAEEKDRAREDFERKSRDGLRLKEDLERQLQKEEGKVLGEVNQFLSKVVIDYGKAHGYDVILDASATLFFSEAVDITDEIIREADEAYR